MTSSGSLTRTTSGIPTEGRSRYEEAVPPRLSRAETLPLSYASHSRQVGYYHGLTKFRDQRGEDGETYQEYRKLKSQHEAAEQLQRKQAQHDFFSGATNIMVANDAFGQGINLPNISLLIHYGVPKGMEFYLNQFGRAGRDGNPAQCVLVCQPSDFNGHESNIRNDLKRGEIDPGAASAQVQPRSTSCKPLSDPHHRSGCDSADLQCGPLLMTACNEHVTCMHVPAQLRSLRELRDYAFGHGCRYRKVRSYWSEVSEQGELSWTCGKCDCCERDQVQLAPRSFEHIALVVMLMVEEASKGQPRSPNKRPASNYTPPVSIPLLPN